MFILTDNGKPSVAWKLLPDNRSMDCWWPEGLAREREVVHAVEKNLNRVIEAYLGYLATTNEVGLY